MYLGREKYKMQAWKRTASLFQGLTCNVLAAQMFQSHYLLNVTGLSSILERPFWKQRRACGLGLRKVTEEAEARRPMKDPSLVVITKSNGLERDL